MHYIHASSRNIWAIWGLLVYLFTCYQRYCFTCYERYTHTHTHTTHTQTHMPYERHISTICHRNRTRPEISPSFCLKIGRIPMDSLLYTYLSLLSNTCHNFFLYLVSMYIFIFLRSRIVEVEWQRCSRCRHVKPSSLSHWFISSYPQFRPYLLHRSMELMENSNFLLQLVS